GRQVPASDQAGDGGVAEDENCEDERGLIVHSLFLPRRRLNTDTRRHAPGVRVCGVASICRSWIFAAPPAVRCQRPLADSSSTGCLDRSTGLEICRHPMPRRGIGARRRCPQDLLLPFLSNCYSPQSLILLCLAEWYR